MKQESLQEKKLSSFTVSAIIFLFYFLPILSLSLGARYSNDGWSIMNVGLLVASTGSFLLYFLFQKWMETLEGEAVKLASSLEKSVTPADHTSCFSQMAAIQQKLEEQLKNYTQLQQDHEQLCEQHLRTIKEKEVGEDEAKKLQKEFNYFKEKTHEQSHHQQNLELEHQQIIAELRDTVDKKQQYVLQLENKTRDLNYELKTLIKLAEKPIETTNEALPSLKPSYSSKQLDRDNDPPIFDFAVKTQEEAHVHLKRIVDVAQRMTGLSPFGIQSRFKNLPLDNYALDLRRLFDRLQEINNTVIFVFSLKENKILFVNEPIKKLMGIIPEKFIQSFPDLLQGNQSEWNEAIRQLTFKNEAKFNFLLKNRQGEDIAIEGLLGGIAMGIFKHTLIAILYSKQGY